MKPKAKASLFEAIEVWMGKFCLTPDRDEVDGYIGDTLALRMADAAEAVFDSHIESQQFCLKEGYLSTE